MTRFILLTLLALSVLVGGLPTAASAAARNGANVVNLEDAHEEPDGTITYITLKGVTTETLTPTGNTIHTGNLRTTATVYDANGALVLTSAGTQHQLRLVKDPSTGDATPFHVWSDRLATTVTYPDGRVCTFTFTIQYVNGQFRIMNDEVVCT